MVIGTIADTLTRGVENVTGTISEAFFDPVIRLGVTGLSRAGKTVFITSLVANLLDRDRMPQLPAQAEGRIALRLPAAPARRHHSALRLRDPPRRADRARTALAEQHPRRVRVAPVAPGASERASGGVAGTADGASRHRGLSRRMAARPRADRQELCAMVDATCSPGAGRVPRCRVPRLVAGRGQRGRVDRSRAQASWPQPSPACCSARAAGFYDCAPGRFLLPGELAGSPVLTFAPLPVPDPAPRKSLWREMERRFEAYKAQVVKPFFRNHFARIDRQVVLVDALGAIHAGPRAVEDLRRAMADILSAFRPGRNAFLTQLFMGRRVERILFAATKADHLHHTQHARLTAIMAGADARRARPGAVRRRPDRRPCRSPPCAPRSRRPSPMAGRDARLRARRAERRRRQAGGLLPRRAAGGSGASAATSARRARRTWLDADYEVMRFSPRAASRLSPGEGPPHIRLDRAAQFLIGDRL